MKADVHVLTLTATPIPRTLQMAMSGLRELSVIQTAPIDRLAVRTYVMPWDDVVIREALLRSEEHTSELQSLMRISYAVFCLKKKQQTVIQHIDKIKNCKQ